MKNVCVLFGGKSSEFFISCISAYTILTHIPREKYRIFPVGITQEGDWYFYEDDVALLQDGQWVHSEKKYPASFLTHSQFVGLTVFRGEHREQLPIDVVFPVLHGKNGEDGTVQGLLDMLEIPYVGCGLLASALAMDKFYTKIVVGTLGIRQTPYCLLRKAQSHEEKAAQMRKAIEQFGYPLFVKPCKAGSSCGVSKVMEAAALQRAIEEAFRFDDKVLLEKAVCGRELECAVLETAAGLLPSRVGEILVTAEFYSYDAKYADVSSRTDTAPVLPPGIMEKIQTAACTIFRELGCRGLSRVDFFLEASTGEVVFNEINTLPGFTNISMYPMLLKEEGYPMAAWIEELLQGALR